MNLTPKAMLVNKGITQAAIAKALDVTPAAVSQVLNGHYNSRRIKKHIADVLGKPYDKLWGKRQGKAA